MFGNSVMNNLNKVFWVLFIVIGAFIIVGALGIIFVDILIGLAVIVIGIHKLEEEFKSKRIFREQEKTNNDIHSISRWMESSDVLTQSMKTRNENRFFHIDNKRAALERELEEKYRDLARKTLELDNKFNEISRAFVKKEVIRSGRGKKIYVDKKAISNKYL